MNRDIKLSNIKGLLIFLVIFGHLIGLYKKEYSNLYYLIYSFHMPLFVLVSGYFAKNANMKKVVNFILLYLIFQPAYRLFLAFLYEDKLFRLKMEVPYFHLWYLISMATWYFLYIIIRKTSLMKINKVVFVLGCFIIAIGSKFLSESLVNLMKNIKDNFYPYSYSSQRSLSFLPFFFLGLYLSKKKMQWLYHSLKFKYLVAAVVIPAAYFYFYLDGPVNKEEILKGSYGVFEMKGSILSISEDILIGYALALIFSYLLLNLVSKKVGILTRWGEHSLPIFLFHTFFIMITKRMSLLRGVNSFERVIIMFVASILIASLLSSKWFVNASYYLIHPIEALELVSRKIIRVNSKKDYPV